jgi:hypothetical protein
MIKRRLSEKVSLLTCIHSCSGYYVVLVLANLITFIAVIVLEFSFVAILQVGYL